MKNTAKLLISAMLLLGTPTMFAQECKDYFPHKEGTVLTYKNYDKKDKVTGTSVISIKERKETPEGISVLLLSKYIDDKGEEVFENQMPVECRNGVLYMDMSKYLDPASMGAYSAMDVEVSADNLDLPLGGPEGTVLGDGTVTAVVRNSGLKIATITMDISDRMIAARERLETPAGAFDCLKITYNILSQIGFVKVNMSATEWYSPEYGTIRSETYNKKGKLVSYMVLNSVD